MLLLCPVCVCLFLVLAPNQLSLTTPFIHSSEVLWGLIADVDSSIAYVFAGFNDEFYLDCTMNRAVFDQML